MYRIFEALLKERGMTVAEVSRQTGIRQSTLSNWKKRDNQLNGKNAALIADLFGVSVDYLMGRTETPDGKERIYFKGKVQRGQGDGTLTTQQHYYMDDETREIAQEIFDDRELHALFDAARGSKPEDLRMAGDLLKRLKETNPNG